MTLRLRVASTAAVAVAVAVLLAFVGLYAVTARTLVGQVDQGLLGVAAEVAAPFDGSPGRGAFSRGDRPALPDGFRGGPRAGAAGGAGGYVRAVGPGGGVVDEQGADTLALPVTEQARSVAAGGADRFLATSTLDEQRFRVLTVPTRTELALQVVRPLDEVDATLGALRRRLVLFGVLGVVLAAALGLLVARRAVRPVDRLTSLAEQVAATGDLSRRIELGTDDEVGRLAATFNGMLAALEHSQAAQEQLVADASHELRTPLTSLRTNIEVLTRGDRLAPEAHRALIRDVVLQLEEFGHLVTGLVELARGGRPARRATPVRLDELVGRVVARVRTHEPDAVPVSLETVPTTVRIEADRVERAVGNLLDNALTYGGDGPVEVGVADGVADGVVTVRDHGPGIAESDLPHVFDRFYRSVEARSAAGSGLGLAIVAQVAADHGGTVTASNTADGGALLRLELPVAGPTPVDERSAPTSA